MKKRSYLWALFSAVAFIFSLSNRLLQADSKDVPANNIEMDNSKINQRDKRALEPTADRAKNDVSDLDLMRKIRRSIVKDKALSIYAKNIKIIAQDGQVTLKGTVHTEDEKIKIREKADYIAGSANVINDITVKGS